MNGRKDPRVHFSIRVTLAVVTTSLVVVLLGTGLVYAQDKDSREISDRWNIRLGYTSTDTRTDLAAGNVLGAVVRIEDVFDFDQRDSTVSLQGFYRFRAEKKGKHSLVFNLVDSSRESAGTIAGSVPILDEEFVGDFESSYDTQSLAVFYRFSMVKTPKAEAGITAGISFVEYDFRISGTVDDNGGTVETVEGADILAPLPSFGFYLKYAVRHNLIFDIGFDSLDIEVGNIDGRVLNSEARLTWYFTRHLGVGLGLGQQDLAVTSSEEGDLFKVDYQQTTITLSLSAVF